MRILAILTCFNRKENTEKCIKDLALGNSDCDITFIAVDDNSTDGTAEMLKALSNSFDLHLIEGNGDLFYSGGMRFGMKYALSNFSNNFDYLFMLNDDVEFFDNFLEKMIAQSNMQDDAVIVGAMQKTTGEQSYGAVKYTKNIKYRKLSIDEWETKADTFNANAVLIPYDAFKKIGAIDEHYVHSLGDFDYGLELKKHGYAIYSSREFVGICNNNSNVGTWNDTSLSRKERFIKKESVKGAPAKQWFYFLKKNFGLATAVKYSLTPYIRIILGK